MRTSRERRPGHQGWASEGKPIIIAEYGAEMSRRVVTRDRSPNAAAFALRRRWRKDS